MVRPVLEESGGVRGGRARQQCVLLTSTTPCSRIPWGLGVWTWMIIRAGKMATPTQYPHHAGKHTTSWA